MSSKTVINAVTARAGEWDGIDLCPLADPNAAPDAEPRETFLSLEFPVGANEDQIGQGDPGLFRESGAFRVVINVLALSGIDQAVDWVEELRDLFRNKWFAGIQTFEASPAPFDENNKRGAYYQVPFAVRYWFDYQK